MPLQACYWSTQTDKHLNIPTLAKAAVKPRTIHFDELQFVTVQLGQTAFLIVPKPKKSLAVCLLKRLDMALVRSAHQEASPSSNTRFSFDVFLSFRGEDTRKNFTDHLYTAFIDAGIRAFRDDDELERGEDIKPELQKAIRQSQCSVIVFSKDYASSGWCLDELALIIERKRTANHVVLPVFYDVDPSHVRWQTGSLAKAFAKHERNPSLKDKVKQWRAALTEVANLSGMVLTNEADGHESKFVKKIVGVMEDKLRRIPLSLEPYVIGIESRAKDINLWLQDGSIDVGILLIHGMRGIGKSTIAKFVYNSNFQRFKRCSFLENIREVSEQSNGLLRLQKQLLNDILTGSKVKIHNISEGIAKIEDVVSSRKVFLVLDDADHVDQLAALLRMQNRFHPGSKIIITSSCAGLLEAHCQFVKVHEVRILGNSESLALFSWHAFGQDYPFQSYKVLSNRVVDHCAGLPLALKVIGSSLSGKSIAVWESALKKLEAIPNGEILKKLKISYDSLQDDHDQNLFLHLVCFFIGIEKDVIATILDHCDFFTEVGIQSLIDRCLVRIDECNKVQMHQMIRDMGREIVRLESKEPGQRSRIWHHNDSCKVLTQNTGTQSIEGLVLNMQMHPLYNPVRNSSKVVLETHAFTRMHNLRLLQLSHVQLSGCYEEFPTGLRWLCWMKFPLASLPSDLSLERVVFLEMCYSSLKQVWRGTKYLPSIKVLNLSHSHDLTETPDFSSVPNLERLILTDCASLVYFHESIGNLGRLVYLNMEDCRSIRKLPKNLSMLILLETLVISGCSSLNEFPVDMRNMESLKVFQADGVPIHRLLTTTGEVELLPTQNLGISWAYYLPRNLVNLSLGNCNLFYDDFPSDFGNLSSLQKLDLGGNPLYSLPDCIRGVAGLHELSFINCTRLKSLVRLPGVKDVVSVYHCPLLEQVTYQSFFPQTLGADSNDKLFEIEGWYKLVPIERVDEEMINLLSLREVDSLETIMVDTVFPFGSGWKGPVQGLYEGGIFSTFLPGNEVPGVFSHRSRGSSVSFTVPLLPNLNIRGLNVFSVSVLAKPKNFAATAVVFNKSKGRGWCYTPFIHSVSDGTDMIWLSHWKFGSQLEGGDVVTVSMPEGAEECGAQLVYHEQEEKISCTQLSITDDPWYLSSVISSTRMPGVNLHCYSVEIQRSTDIINDINEKTNKEEGQQGGLILTLGAQSGSNDNTSCLKDKEEGQQGDLIVMLAEQRASNRSYGGHRGRKWIIIAFVLFLSVFSAALISSLLEREKQQARILIPT